MRIRAINAEKMGLSNRLTLINLIRTNPGVSRRELSRLAGLDPSTVTKIITSLLDKGLVVEQGVRDADQPGRKSIMLRVSRDAAVCLAAEVGVESTRIAAGYLDASFEVLEEFPTPSGQDAFFRAFAERMEAVRESSGPREFCALSFSVPGMVEWGSNILKHLPHMGWKDVNLGGSLQRTLPWLDLPVFAANEAKLSLIAEMFRNPGISRLHSGVYVYLSQGVGGALLVGDKIIHGAGNTAGELGHMVIDASGPLCHCGSRGCFETFVSIDRVVKNYEERKEPLPGRNFREKFRLLLDRSSSGDGAASDVLEEMKEYLAIGLSNLANILNPDFIMLGGVGSIFPSAFIRSVSDAVTARALGPAGAELLFTRASLGIESAALEGATLMAMNHHIKKVI